MEKGISGIYKITNPKGRVYIGQSKCIKSRWRVYQNGHKINQPMIKNSLLKYGPENHIFEVVEKCDVEDLNRRERHWQDYYDVLNREKGLNCNLTDTDSQVKVMSEETKEKMRKAKEGKYFGTNSPFFGKKHSEESRKKMSEANIEFLKHNPHPVLGRKVPEELKKRMSEERKGKPRSEEVKKKISEANKGRGLGLKMSEEARINMSRAKLGEKNVRAKSCMNIETGVYFGCIKDAAIAYGLNKEPLQRGLNKSKKYKQFLLL